MVDWMRGAEHDTWGTTSAKDKCVDHLNFTSEACPDCGLEVDAYGNTEDQFDHCSFPDCGCDGARLCMAGEASFIAQILNREKGARD